MSAYGNEELSSLSPPLPPKLHQTAPPIPPKLKMKKNDEFFKNKSEGILTNNLSKPNKNIPKNRPNRNIFVQNEGYHIVDNHNGNLHSDKDPSVIYENKSVVLAESIGDENKSHSLVTKIKSFFKKKQFKKVKTKELRNNEYFSSYDSATSVLPLRNNHSSEISFQSCRCSESNQSWNVRPPSECCCCRCLNSCQFRIIQPQHCHLSCVPLCQMQHLNTQFHNMPNINRCVNCQTCSCNTHSRTPSFGHFTSFAGRCRSVQSNHDRQSPDNDPLESIDSITESRPIVPQMTALPVVQVGSHEGSALHMSLHGNIQLLRKVGWYWGSLKSDEAEEVMEGRCDGTFIVRDSCHADYLFSITFRVNGSTHHTRIQFSQHKFWLTQDGENDGFNTVTDLIESTVRESKNGKYRYFQNIDNLLLPTYAVILLLPLSRFRIMSSLKHIARFVIVSHVRSDHLDQLPLPEYLISYLQDKDHHYVENLYNYVNIMNVNERPSET